MEEIKARRAEIEKLKLSEENNMTSPAMTSQGGADGEGGVAKEPEEDKSEHVFIAVGRVFSGTIRKGDSLKALRKVFITRVSPADFIFFGSLIGRLENHSLGVRAENFIFYFRLSDWWKTI